MQERILHKSFYRNYEMMFSTVWKTCFHGVENYSGLAHDVSRSYAPLAALAGDGARPGAAPPRLRSASRLLRGCGRAVVPRAPDHAAYGGCRECGLFLARRGGGGLRFPPPGFSPRRPLFGGAPFSARIIGRGANPSPFGRWRSLAGGNRTAAISV